MIPRKMMRRWRRLEPVREDGDDDDGSAERTGLGPIFCKLARLRIWNRKQRREVCLGITRANKYLGIMYHLVVPKECALALRNVLLAFRQMW